MKTTLGFLYNLNKEGLIDNDALDVALEEIGQYANQRVIEELENVFHNSDYATNIALHHRLQELKQD